MPPILQVILKESADLLVTTVKVTIGMAILTIATVLVGLFFSSNLPYQALLMINGRQ